MKQSDLAFIAQTYNKSLKLIGSVLESKLTDTKVSFDMFMILHFIASSGTEPITLSEIADNQEVTKSAISRKVGTLLNLGLIQQENDKIDRRKKYLTLTTEGQEFYKTNDKVYKKLLNDVTKEYGIDNFMNTLKQVNEILTIIKNHK